MKKSNIKNKRIKKEQIKLAMNKRVYFTLTGCPKKLHGLSNRYCYKSNMHKLIFKDGKFENVRYRSSIITNCNFNNTVLLGVDFCNCNLRKSRFKNATLNNVCFINCNLEGVDFTNSVLQNVVFICTNIERANNFPTEGLFRMYNSYPKISISYQTQEELLALSSYKLLYEPHVLHVSQKKLNYWTLKVLIDIYGEDVFRALRAVKNKSDKRCFYTVFSYMKYIEKYLKL